jgi:hypothetical protein
MTDPYAGEGSEKEPSEKVTPFPKDTIDPDAWVAAYQTDFSGHTIKDWFKAAMQAAYDAARPLDPDKIYRFGADEGEPIED